MTVGKMGNRVTCVDQQQLNKSLSIEHWESSVRVTLALPAVHPRKEVYSRGHVGLQDDVIIPMLLSIHLLPKVLGSWRIHQK
jgi:hypothetical protein